MRNLPKEDKTGGLVGALPLSPQALLPFGPHYSGVSTPHPHRPQAAEQRIVCACRLPRAMAPCYRWGN